MKLLLFLNACLLCWGAAAQPAGGTAPALLQLFRNWRSFEQPPLHEGVPDYRAATFAKRRPAFEQLRRQLQQVDTVGWPGKWRADWMLLYAELNGYDFNERILQPWVRDPAFYKTVWMEQSDVPAHEGPTHHALIEVWQYRFPLDAPARRRLLQQLTAIAPLRRQAQQNLTGNARELWIAGIRDIRRQSADLRSLQQYPGVAKDSELQAALSGAINSTENFVQWLEGQAPLKTGPSGIGKDNYTWYQNHVHLVPLSWEEEVALLRRELGRAWAALQLEEQRNRHLPFQEPASDSAAYQQRAKAGANHLLQFLDQQQIVTVAPYFKTALDRHLGTYVPPLRRNFFWITAHLDPRPLYSHFYHWFELARMEAEPHPNELRRGALLYNIFDSRNEGLATAVEEWWMQAGLYDSTPRSRELVYILIAQRAARGLGSLYAHANLMTMEAAGAIHSEYTPRGWMKTEKELLLFEQHLYLRQPGYGTSYITGKYLLEQLMAEYARNETANGRSFSMKSFMDRLNATGCIPVTQVALDWLSNGELLHR